MARLKNLLILGGTGFIGSNIANFFSKKNYKIICIGTNKSIKKLPKVKYYFLKLSSIKKSHEVFRLKNLYIINLTGYIDHSIFSHKSNELAKSHLYSVIKFCSYLNKKNVVRFINIGSSDEYGKKISPLRETQREEPESFYSFLKTSLTHFFQMLHRSTGFPSVIVRLFLVYGPGQKKNRLIPYVIDQLLNKKNVIIRSNGRQKKDFLYIDDLSKIIEKILISKKFEGEIINVGSGSTITIKNVIKKIKNQINFGEIIYTQTERSSENVIQYPSLTKLNSYLTLKNSTSLELGLKKTISYYKKI